MTVDSAVRVPEVEIDGALLERARKEGKAIVLYPTLKFSCLIAKRFKAELRESVEDYDVKESVGGVPVFIKFRAVGSRFCGGDRGFEEVDFPVLEPERFMPRWIRVYSDLSGEFGYK